MSIDNNKNTNHEKDLYLFITGGTGAVVFTSCRKEKVYYDDHSILAFREQDVVTTAVTPAGLWWKPMAVTPLFKTSMDCELTMAICVYGDLALYGTRTFYNYSADVLTRGNVVEYDLQNAVAQVAIDYYCPTVKQTG